MGQHRPGSAARRAGGRDRERAADERSRGGRSGRSHRCEPLADRRRSGGRVGDARHGSDVDPQDRCTGVAGDGSHRVRAQRSEDDLRGFRGSGVYGLRVRGEGPSQVHRWGRQLAASRHRHLRGRRRQRHQGEPEQSQHPGRVHHLRESRTRRRVPAHHPVPGDLQVDGRRHEVVTQASGRCHGPGSGPDQLQQPVRGDRISVW